MLEDKVLICKLLGSIYGPGASSIAVDKVPTLDHKAFDLAQSVYFLFILLRYRGGLNIETKVRLDTRNAHQDWRVMVGRYSPHDGTCSPCSLAAGLESS